MLGGGCFQGDGSVYHTWFGNLDFFAPQHILRVLQLKHLHLVFPLACGIPLKGATLNGPTLLPQVVAFCPTPFPTASEAWKLCG